MSFGKANEDINCTTIFLLPGIGLTRKDILKHGFITAYINDKDYPVYKNSVYLLYKPEDIHAFDEFLKSEYNRTNWMLEDYDYEGGYIVTVYKFPEKFMREYNLFLKGKYSQFGPDYVNLFPEKVEIVKNGKRSLKFSLAYHIFNRSEAIRKYWERMIGEELPADAELWSSPNIETTETLDINNIKK